MEHVQDMAQWGPINQYENYYFIFICKNEAQKINFTNYN